MSDDQQRPLETRDLTSNARNMRGTSDVRQTNAKVRDIIDEITALPKGSIAEQQSLFNELIFMGDDAVPEIINLMDDRRQLSVSAISLRNNFPGAFEGLRHYSPETMVDALAAVLNQITGQSFGFIYNGGTEAERQATVTAWRNWGQSRLRR